MPRRNAPRQRVVNFARINRRTIQRMELETFRTAIMRLADSHTMEAEQEDKTWFAGDAEVRDEVLLGILGYRRPEWRVTFNREEWSWRKGAQTAHDRANPRTLVPYAVDLREENRWIAFAPHGHLNARAFPSGFRAVLNEAQRRVQSWYFDWDVDLVGSGIALREWVAEHPDVSEMRLSLRLRNPGRTLDPDRERMQRLNAERSEQVFRSARNEMLDVESEVEDLSTELEGTNTDITLKTRDGEKFDSRSPFNQAREYVENFEEDMTMGLDLMYDVLRQFVAQHRPIRYTGDPADEAIS